MRGAKFNVGFQHGTAGFGDQPGRDFFTAFAEDLSGPQHHLLTCSRTLGGLALGYDISGTQHVIVAEWQPPRSDDTLVVALRRTLLELRSSALVSRRADMAVAVVRGDPLGAEVFSVVARALRSATGAVGIGGPSADVSQLPRSFSEALHALHIRAGSIDRYGVTRFDQLGIYRILDTAGGEPDLAGYIDEWLGNLQLFDDSRGSDLVQTLAQYLDYGGNYDSTAESLSIHRSTLRYRLKSIRQISGFDIADPETRLNLHVATRAWRLRPPGAHFMSHSRHHQAEQPR